MRARRSSSPAGRRKGVEIPQPAENRSADALETEITQLLAAWGRGDLQAAEAVLPLVYPELRRIARGCFRQWPEDTLQPTALVHEAYVHFTRSRGVQWESRAHFYGAAARAMRQILVDHYRSKRRAKRGAGASRLPICDEILPNPERAPNLLQLDNALSDLERVAPELAAVVELRYFGGLSHEDVAEYLKISRATSVRRWRRARAWLYDELRG